MNLSRKIIVRLLKRDRYRGDDRCGAREEKRHARRRQARK
jgi:hypothetical protein